MNTPFRRPVQPLRYRVMFWSDDQPDVSYHCSLGTVNARRWAMHTARQYAGHLYCEYSDGTSERIDLNGASFGQPVLPSEQPKAA